MTQEIENVPVVKIALTKNVICREIHFKKAGDKEPRHNYAYDFNIITAKGAIKITRGHESGLVESPQMTYVYAGVMDEIEAVEDDTLIFAIHILREEDGTYAMPDDVPLNEEVKIYLDRLTVKE
jgi:hypothetical protein